MKITLELTKDEAVTIRLELDRARMRLKKEAAYRDATDEPGRAAHLRNKSKLFDRVRSVIWNGVR